MQVSDFCNHLTVLISQEHLMIPQNLSFTDRNKESNVNRDLHLICGESVDNWRKVVDLNVSVNESCPEPWAF